MTRPMTNLKARIAPGADLSADPDGWPWVDITPYLRDVVEVQHGRRAESTDVRPDEAVITVQNDNGEFCPDNPLGPWYPDLDDGTPLQIYWGSTDNIRFMGHIIELPISWRVPTRTALSTVRASGPLRRVQQGEQPLGSALSRAVSSHPQVVAYWPCEDGSEADAAASPLDGVPPMAPSGVEFGAPTTQAGSTLHGASSVMRIAEGARNVLGRVPNHTPGDAYLVQLAWLMPETATTDTRAVLEVQTTSQDAARWDITVGSSNFSVSARDADGVQVVDETQSTNEAVWGRWVRAVLRLQQDGSDIRWQASLLDITSAQTRLHHLQGVEASASMGRITRAGVNGPGMFQERFAGHITVSTADAADLDDPWLTGKIDAPAVGGILGSVPAPATSPGGLAWDGADLWHADRLTATIYRLDPRDGSTVDSFPSPGTAPTGLAWDGEALWHCDDVTGTIYRLDPGDGSTLDSFSAPQSQPVGLAWDGTNLWSSDISAETIYRLDPSDGSVLDSFPSPGTAPTGLAWDGEALWNADLNTQTIYRIDPGDGSVLDSFPWAGTDPWGLTWDGTSLWLTDLFRLDIFRLAVVVQLSAADGYAGEPAGFRFRRLCAEQGIPAVLVGDGDDTMPMGPQQPATLTDLLRECADTDGGRLHEHDAALHYRTRTDLYNQDVALTVTPEPHMPQPPEPTRDIQRVVNDIAASRPFGTSARAVDQASIGQRGRFDQTVTVNPSSDERLAQIAHWKLHLGTTPGMRWPRLPLRLSPSNPDLISDWLGVDVGDRIAVDHQFAQLPGVAVDLILGGWAESWDSTRWDVEMNCLPARPYTVFEVEDDELGRADTAGATLGSAIDEDDTTLTVVSTGRPWINTSDHGAQFPFTVEVGGEEMTVSAISGSTSPQVFTVTRSANGVTKSHDAGAAVRLASRHVLAL